MQKGYPFRVLQVWVQENLYHLMRMPNLGLTYLIIQKA